MWASARHGVCVCVCCWLGFSHDADMFWRTTTMYIEHCFFSCCMQPGVWVAPYIDTPTTQPPTAQTCARQWRPGVCPYPPFHLGQPCFAARCSNRCIVLWCGKAQVLINANILIGIQYHQRAVSSIHLNTWCTSNTYQEWFVRIQNCLQC